ncbi:hypothetical protein SGFS_104420 [Streptomyces graminofaciens]|uniref:Uncharacterized protein n=1 Tax=Streptomyces graminofaciens TaxID=68212 RepID=A0ABM7FT69_9ACTN|nr:hypothetical protein SGFS_104420 [Streptomyces graminofaciens]
MAGGLLVEADWRWVFLVNVPVGLAGLVAGARLLPDPRPDREGPLPDLVGAALLTLGIGALALGLVKADAWAGVRPVSSAHSPPWSFSARPSGCGRRAHAAPVVELPLLRIPAFTAATVAALLFTVAFAAMLLTSVLWCQQVWNYSAIQTGLAIAPGPLVVTVLAMTLGPVVQRFGAGRTARTRLPAVRRRSRLVGSRTR